MADFDDDAFWEPTGDDLQAQRILNLAILFMNSASFVPTREIHRLIYEDLGYEAFQKKFKNDRERLALCGVILENKLEGSESLWKADSEASFVTLSGISQEDAMLLDLVCLPCVANPTFAFRDELRLALAKIDRSFGSSVVAAPADARGTSSSYRKLQQCHSARQAAVIDYVDAKGNASVRQVAPLGFFGVGENTYVVAVRVDDDGNFVPDSIRTYAASRLGKVTPKQRLTFEIPDDFYVDDFIRLPFQIGPTIYEASFLVPADAERDLRASAKGKGSFARDGERLVWTVDVSSEAAAAAFAISMSVLPMSPASLVGTWREVLEGVVSRG